jgi:hypothetical protein
MRIFGGLPVSAQELLETDDAVLQRAVEKLDLPEQFEFNRWLRQNKKTDKEATSVLVEHFEAEERRRVEPWRVDAERARVKREQWLALPFEEHKRRFAELAKEGELSPFDALIGTYVLHGSEQSMKMLSALICFELPKDRIAAHNQYVAECMGEAWCTQHGERLKDLKFPLFPPLEAFSIVNHRLLRELTAVSGGGPRLPSVYRNTEGNELEGGSMLPVVQGPEGSCVDVSIIEAAFVDVNTKLQWLNTNLEQMKATGIPPEKVPVFAQQVRQAQSSMRRGRGGFSIRGRGGYGYERGRGGYGSRGRGGRGYWGSGEPQLPFAETAPTPKNE